MKRILHVFGRMDCGGAETRTMDIYRKINKKELQFDFLTMKSGKGYYDQEINSLGGNIYTVNRPSTFNLLRHIKEIKTVIKKNGPYHAVHAHTSFHTGIVSIAAFLAGSKIRISHSRSASNRKKINIFRKIYFTIMRIIINIFSTQKVACGKKAAYFLFGKRSMINGKVKIIKNAIDFDSYKNLEFRSPKLRKSLGIKDSDFIIGHVGSFSKVKNHSFIIEIAKELSERKAEYKLIFVGEGPLKNSIKQDINKYGLEDNVIFLGLRADIPDIMSMIDLLLLPSHYEGVPGVVVEAQAAGTPCLVSEKVTREVDSNLGLVEFLAIENPQYWVSRIQQTTIKKELDQSLINKILKENDFLVESSIRRFKEIYKMF